MAMGLAAILLPALLTGLVASRSGKAQQLQRVAAIPLSREAIEAVRTIREAGWEAFAVNGTYHPATASGTWVLVAGGENINGFTRSVVISDVMRDTSGNIVTTGGIIDPSSKRVDVNVGWTLPSVTTITTTQYLTRFRDNFAYLQSTEAELDTGTKTGTDVVNVSGGEVELSQNTKAKWCSPAFSSSTIDLPDGPPVAVATRANAATTTPNDVLVATAPTTTSATKMAYIKVSANTDPPVSTLNGIFTLDPSLYSDSGLVPTGIGLDNTFKTNDIKYYTSAGDKLYALIATDKPDREVIAILLDDTNLQDPVNKIYKYWTYFNTKNFGTPFYSPSANAAETSNAGDNNGFQTTPTFAYANDGGFAVDENSGNNTGTSCTGNDKDKHRYYDFNFSVPVGTTINGIETQLVAKVDSTSGFPRMCVQLSWNGGTSWTAAKSTALTTSSVTYTLGGVTDTWGRTWGDSDFSNANFRVRITNVASNTSRDFSLDWVGVKVDYNGSSTVSNDLAPYGYGGTTLTVLEDKGYVASGGYLYVFDLSNIDSKSTSVELDQVGCRIELNGYDCNPATSRKRKYGPGDTDLNWNADSAALSGCSDGGNIELYADNDIHAVKDGSDSYIFVAVGNGDDPELNIVNATSIPDGGSSPAISNSSCGTIANGNSGWKRIGSLDFNQKSGTQEAANSVYVRSDGNRAYISSNGGIDGDNNGQPDSKQYYVINTTNKSSPAFLTTSAGPEYQATSGFYLGSGADGEMYPRRSLTVLNGLRVVLVGKDGVVNANDAQEYQVLNSETEATPLYCGGINFDLGFNDLTSVSEADGDNFVYMVANTTLNELKIIQGGPDGAYEASGTFESATFDPGYNTSFNHFTANISKPTNTTINLQVGVAAQVAGSCTGASFTYVGPGGDTGAYFEPVAASISGTIPFSDYAPSYTNPGRCFRYRVNMSTTDLNASPKLLDFTANYSP